MQQQVIQPSAPTTVRDSMGRTIRRVFAAFGYKLMRQEAFDRISKERSELRKKAEQQSGTIKSLQNGKAPPRPDVVPCGDHDIMEYLRKQPNSDQVVRTLSDLFEDDASRQTLAVYLKRLRALGGTDEFRETQSCDIRKLGELTALAHETEALKLSKERQRNHCAYGLYMLDDKLQQELRSACHGKVAIDGGAYDGETAQMLISDFGASKVYAFEPISFDKVVKYAATHPNIVPVEGGLYSEYRENVSFTYYEGRLFGATMLAVNKPKVDLSRVFKLDDYVKEHQLELGCIKLDVEGAEYDVIIGSEETIKQQKPLLLISVYHTGKDLFEIAPLLKKWRPDYRFYMRHIRPLATDRFFHTCEYVIYAL